MSCLLKDAISKIRTKNAEAMVIILGGKAPECVLTLKMLAANHPYFTVKEVLTSAHLAKVQPAILSFVQNSLGEHPRSSSLKTYLVLQKNNLPSLRETGARKIFGKCFIKTRTATFLNCVSSKGEHLLRKHELARFESLHAILKRLVILKRCLQQVVGAKSLKNYLKSLALSTLSI